MDARKSRTITAVMFILAAGLILFGAIGGTRSVLMSSETHKTEIATKSIDICLNENGKQVAEDQQLLEGLLGDDANVCVGKKYPETLSITNNGEIAQYVRMTIRKYWKAKDVKKTDLKPQEIILGLTGNGCIQDKDKSTPERTVLYYRQPLAAGDTTKDAIDGLTISTDVARVVDQKVETKTENGKTYKTITNVYAYNGMEFGITAEADGIQTHNAEDAIKASWSVSVDISEDGTLSLK